jgi:tetratricopeptide (TPR) repeat protein
MSEYPYDLGAYSRPISTTSPDAQIWFDRGFNWAYGFHHEEAEVCFKRALDADPNCSMVHWALAYIAGPNYNRPWELFSLSEINDMLAVCRHRLDLARAALDTESSTEAGLIDALTYRYQSTQAIENMYDWSAQYADAMRALYTLHPDDPDVAALFAEAMMNRHPWKLWNLRSGLPTQGADTLEARQVLEAAMRRDEGRRPKSHPGLLHLYIHLMEMSPTPEAALKQADLLRDLVPDAGHLPHMATHIDVLCGNYQEVVASNNKGIAADELYWKHAGGMNFYSLYRVHNYHFKLYGAMFLGQFQPALDAAEGLKRTIPPELLHQKSPPLVDWLEGYMGIEIHALVRFGKWQELVDAPLPHDRELYAMTTAMWFYGKGVALAALGQHDEAVSMQERFEVAALNVPESRYLHVVSCEKILGVARQMQMGEIAYHAGQYEAAFNHLREAVKKEDALPYDEPWGWMMPSRHALGALLSEQGHYDEAIEAYEADLGLNKTVIRANRHPNNVWALIGLYKCYEATGLDKKASLIKPQLDTALAHADKEIYASCFCAKSI